MISIQSHLNATSSVARQKYLGGGLLGAEAFKWGASPETERTLLQYGDTSVVLLGERRENAVPPGEN